MLVWWRLDLDSETLNVPHPKSLEWSYHHVGVVKAFIYSLTYLLIDRQLNNDHQVVRGSLTTVFNATVFNPKHRKSISQDNEKFLTWLHSKM